MHDDELKRAWAALQVQRRAAQTSASPTPSLDDIEGALDGTLSNENRERVLDAVLAQGRAEELRMMYTMRQAAANSTSSTASVGRWPQWWPAAAAAALIMAVGIPTWQSQRARTAGSADSATYRSGTANELQLIAPASSTTWPTASGSALRVLWHAVPSATGYQVELVDAEGRVVSTQSVTGDTTVLLSAANLPREAVPVGWWVSATLADGRTVRSELRLLEPHRP